MPPDRWAKRSEIDFPQTTPRDSELCKRVIDYVEGDRRQIPYGETALLNAAETNQRSGYP